MLCNPNDPDSKKAAYVRFFELMEGKDLFELTSKGARTLRQNSYLHLCLGYLAAELGLRLEYVKEEYYKKIVNPDLFIFKFFDPIKGSVEAQTKSSKDLTKEQMSVSIERLKIWSAEVAGIPLPDAEDKNGVQQMMLEVNKAKHYI